jgi:hypothetical protein
LDIFNFEDFISDKILGRGRRYFEDDRVRLLQRDGDTWSAQVRGSEYYHVCVSMINKTGAEIDDAVCDCPYTDEAFCKHIAATLYAIREKTICGTDTLPAESRKHKKPRPDISVGEILDSLEKPELESLLREFIQRVPALEDDLIFRYRDKSDSTLDPASYARELMESSLIGAASDGYVDWTHMPEALKGVGKAQHLAKECLKKGDFDAYTETHLAIIEAMMTLRDSCENDAHDDIEGIISYSVDSLKKGLKRILLQDTDARRRIFGKILDHALSPLYNYYETARRYELLEACATLTTDAMIIKSINAYLDSREKALKSTKSSYCAQKEQGYLQQLRKRIIGAIRGDEAMISYMKRHLDNEEFRKELFDLALEAGDLHQALRLCRGEDSTDKPPRALSGSWKTREHDVYVLLRDQENQRRTARELFLCGYGQGLEYYLEFKSLTPQKDWGQALNNLLASLQGNRSWGRNRYLEVLKHEELRDRIMDHCRKSHASVFGLYPYLLPQYKSEVDKMFVEVIRESLRMSYTRKHYAELRKKLSCYGAAMGLDKARRLRDSFLTDHPKKPALREELSVL